MTLFTFHDLVSLRKMDNLPNEIFYSCNEKMEVSVTCLNRMLHGVLNPKLEEMICIRDCLHVFSGVTENLTLYMTGYIWKHYICAHSVHTNRNLITGKVILLSNANNRSSFFRQCANSFTESERTVFDMP